MKLLSLSIIALLLGGCVTGQLDMASSAALAR